MLPPIIERRQEMKPPISIDEIIADIIPRLNLYQIILYPHQTLDGYVCELIWHSTTELGMHDGLRTTGKTLQDALLQAVTLYISGLQTKLVKETQKK
jgi:hypothetical protein